MISFLSSNKYSNFVVINLYPLFSKQAPQDDTRYVLQASQNLDLFLGLDIP